MSKAKSTGPSQLQLISSNRLQALRNKFTEQAQNQPPAKSATQSEDAETAKLRQLVERRLAQILATMPAGKHRSLFKIRFGVELDHLQSMSPQQALKALKIRI